MFSRETILGVAGVAATAFGTALLLALIHAWAGR